MQVALLSVILALLLTLGSCAGIDTSQIEDYAASLGIEPAVLPIGLGGSSSAGDDFSWDDLDFESPWTEAANAEECAAGAGIDSFPSFDTVDINYDDPAFFYYYQDGHAQALCIYYGLSLVIDKAVYEGVDDISEDDRTFDLEWSETIEGVEVTCFGFEEGMTNKALFIDGDYVYAIEVWGSDDDLLRGLTSEELALFVTALL